MTYKIPFERICKNPSFSAPTFESIIDNINITIKAHKELWLPELNRMLLVVVAEKQTDGSYAANVVATTGSDIDEMQIENSFIDNLTIKRKTNDQQKEIT